MKKYYPEIDGLRAIAVLAVLAFHLNPNGFFTGGYVGVDVFFVISGYLITGIIYQSITNDNFNYFQFLDRRIARLYPALLFTIFVILILGFLIYSTEFYTDAANKIKYTLFSISNVKFMKQGGYWDISSTESPLLHTWSLGVEQQFYLIFPLILFAVYKFFKSKRFIIFSIIIISILSLCVAQYLSIKNPSANFYFTLSRLFELGVGGIFAVVGTSCKVISNTKKEILFSFGLALILFCAICYVSDIKYHPGVTTLPVVIGSVLCILYGDAKYAGRIVRKKYVVYIGAISYSIYLIHWPLITFYKYLYHKNILNSFEQIVLFIVTISIASLMYHFIENKYRRISISIFTKTGKVFLSLFIFVCLINFSITYFKGIPQRVIPYSEEVIQKSMYAGFMPEYSNTWESGLQILGDKTRKPIAIFVGDSFLGQNLEQIDLFFKDKKESIYEIGSRGCRFIDNAYSQDFFETCKERTKEFYNLLKQSDLPVVRISAWDTLSNIDNAFFYDENKNNISISLEYILKELNNQLKNRHTLFIIPPPFINFDFDKRGAPLISNSKTFNTKKCDDKDNKLRLLSNDKIKKFATDTKSSFIETYDIFCDKGYIALFNKDENAYNYSWGGHLSRVGAKLAWDNSGERIYNFIINNKKAD